MAVNKPQRVYIETSVWNFPFADDVPQRRDVTKAFFEQVQAGIFVPYIADIVLRELEQSPEPLRAKLLGMVAEIGPTLLEGGDEVLDLTHEYVRNGTIPMKYLADAAHIAHAVVAGLDLLVSWNFKHIVKAKTRRLVSATGRLSGYREIEICSPEEVLDEAD